MLHAMNTSNPEHSNSIVRDAVILQCKLFVDRWRVRADMARTLSQSGEGKDRSSAAQLPGDGSDGCHVGRFTANVTYKRGGPQTVIAHTATAHTANKPSASHGERQRASLPSLRCLRPVSIGSTRSSCLTNR